MRRVLQQARERWWYWGSMLCRQRERWPDPQPRGGVGVGRGVLATSTPRGLGFSIGVDDVACQ